MAIYDLGTASLAANGEVTGVGTTWKAPLTLIRVGATIVFKTEPVQIYTISEIISDTQVNVYNPNSETVPAGTGYAILAHDGITVQGLAQDVAETLRYYQSRETEVADAVDAFNNFDVDAFNNSVSMVSQQSQQVANDAIQVSNDKNSAMQYMQSASDSATEALASQQSASDYADRAESAAQSLSSSLSGTFQGGITIETKYQQIFDESTGTSYIWNGQLPKVVPPESSPRSTGGVSPSAWVQIGLGALKSGTRIVYASDYGVLADGVSDDTIPLRNLSVAVSTMADYAVKVIFPKGTSLVGSQEQAPNATSGYSFRPTYASAGGVAWFYVNGRSGITIIEAYGYTIKLNDNLKIGSFNPVTGDKEDTALPFRDLNYQAYPGNAVAFRECGTVIRHGMKVDGNAQNMNWGGVWGDSGWQCIAFGIWETNNTKIISYNDDISNCALDNIYIANGTSSSPLPYGLQRSADYYNGLYTDGRRQNISIVSGANIRFHGGGAYRAGRKASGAGVYYSAPESNLDIETEVGPLNDVILNDFKLIEAGRYSFVAASLNHQFRNCILNRCTLRTNGPIAQMYINAPGVKFNSCLIEGCGFEVRKANAGNLYTEFNDCVIRNQIAGELGDYQRYVGEYGLFKNCFFDIMLGAKMSSSKPLFGITAWDSAVSPTYPGRGVFNGCTLNLTGNQDLISPASNGRVYLGSIQFFFDMDLRIITNGMTGTTICDIDTAGSFVSDLGVTVDSARVVDRNTGLSYQMDNGGYMIGRASSVAATVIQPKVANQCDLGTNTHRFKDIYISQTGGLNIRDPSGKAWKVTVSTAGVLTVVAA